jgi:osmoprotectant transport system substrate-binding protein
MTVKARLLIVVVIVAVVVAAMVLVPTIRELTRSAPRVVVGGKNFTEQEVLGEMMAILIEEHTDLDVKRQLNLGGTMICFNALRSGDLDVYADYTGTGLVEILDREVISDPDEAYRVVSEAFRKKYDLVWLEPFGFNNTYTITMRRKHAEELGLETISGLAEYLRGGGELEAGFDPEFMGRPDGYPGLKEAYDFRFPSKPKQMHTGLMYRAAADGEVDVICGFATDGRIAAYDLKILTDDKGFFPPYDAAPVVRASTLEEFPQLRDVLNKLGGRISPQEMQNLNYQVDEQGRGARKVAREFLIRKGLVSPKKTTRATTQPAQRGG